MKMETKQTDCSPPSAKICILDNILITSNVLNNTVTEMDTEDVLLSDDKKAEESTKTCGTEITGESAENILKLRKSKRLVIDSDDSDQEQNETVDDETELEPELVKTTHKRIISVDSEYEDEPITPHNKSYTEENPSPNEAKSSDDKIHTIAPIYTTNSKGELAEETPIGEPTGLAALFDSESSADEAPATNSDNEDHIKPVQYKRKTKNKENEGPAKKMTAKKAAEQRREIQAESQRMLRETNVSLPYHKPKSYSLKEFLAKRKKFSSSLPSVSAKAPPSVAIKMSKEQLELVSKNIKQREAEIKEFYKSESEESAREDDDADDEDYKPDEKSEEITQENVTETQSEEVPADDINAMESEDIIEKEPDQEILETEPNPDNLTEKEPDQEIPEKEPNPDNLTEKEPDQEILEKEPNPDNLTENKTDEELATETPDLTESPNKARNSLEFDFNLDVLDSETLDTTDEHSKTIDPYNLDLMEEEEEPQKTTLELLKEKLANTCPKLSGDPNQMIDLDMGMTKPSEVSKLMERFVRETAKVQQHHKHTVKLNIVRVTGGEILNETVSMNVDDDEIISEEKPGAKLQKLKDELKKQMALKRTKQWQQKATATIVDESKNQDKEGYEDYDDAILDNEDEEEFSDGETESEPEENDVDLTDDVQKKSEFIDGEAQDDDEDEENMADDEDEENMADDERDNEENEDETSQGSKYSDVYDGIKDLLPKKKTLKRILKAFTEDSDDDEDSSVLNKTENKSMDDTLTQDDEAPRPHQTEQLKTPQKTISNQKSEFAFLTPITFMTGLQNLNSASKAKDSPAAGSPFNSEPSPFKNPNWHVGLQKQLFSEESESSDNQTITPLMTTQDESELANMCTGQFQSPDANETINNDSETMEELAGMCTGQFNDTQSAPNTQDLANVCTGGFILTGDKVTHQFNPTKEVKSLDEDQDLLISQLLDEEEMEKFKKKFNSPLIGQPSDEVIGGGVIDSDSDEETDSPVKKKKKKKLVFSDDDDDNSDEDNDNSDEDLEEEIKLHDEDLPSDDEQKNVNYDSEENEIQVNNDEEDDEEMVQKASEFLDGEAELTESEWGSADEDEDDAMDILDTEKGDMEKFDQNKLRSDLEKIHMRQVLDDDNRDIKLLQELLLEDGELHGSGRQRQFKWKNINDSMDNDDDERQEEDEAFLDEDETEEEWRKKRFERETFLREQLAKKSALGDEDNLVSDSQILKLGQKVINKSILTSQTSVISEEKPQTTKPFSLLSKRGSFLSRSEQVLQRLAEYNKVSKGVLGAATAKNSKNFVFQTVQADNNVSLVQDKKRKATEGTPTVLKKLRLSSNFSPLVGKKDKIDRAKKLFGSQ